MGSGSWSNDDYDQLQQARAARGQSAFAHNQQMHSVPKSQQAVHPDLNPLGATVRESRDSDEHPNSTAIALKFDQTGSMGIVPEVLQQELKPLFGILLRSGSVTDPQIAVGAIGDGGMSEVAPLQISQFESDIRIEENLGKIFLEGLGGGNMRESYDLALYFIARHTAIDCWEKRRDKGVLFLFGDELPYEAVSRRTVKQYIGDDLEEDIPLETILKEVQERWEVFFLMADQDNYGEYHHIYDRWQKLLGERAIELRKAIKDLSEISPLIASIIRSIKGDDQASIIHDLQQVGSKASTIQSISTALTRLGSGNSTLAKSSGSLSGLASTNQGGSPTRRL